MKKSEFENRIAELRSSVVPPCPANLEQNVQRRIRMAQGNEQSSWDWLWSWMQRPTFSVAALAIALTSSLGVSAIATNAQRSHQPPEARIALGFESFGETLKLPTDLP